MGRERSEENIQWSKTAAVIGAVNLLMAPLYWADAKLGLTASIAATGALIYGMHEVGKERRPVQNAMNRTHNFFAPEDGRNLENSAKNIVNGGAAVFDETRNAFQN